MCTSKMVRYWQKKTHLLYSDINSYVLNPGVHTYINDHANSGQSSSQVLWVRWPHCHGDDPGVEAAVEGSDQVDACRTKRLRVKWLTPLTRCYVLRLPGG